MHSSLRNGGPRAEEGGAQPAGRVLRGVQPAAVDTARRLALATAAALSPATNRASRPNSASAFLIPHYLGALETDAPSASAIRAAERSTGLQ
jgi:hypothetical protein